MKTRSLGAALGACLIAMAAAAVSPSAFAEYPDKPIKVIVPWPAGGGTDVVARSVLAPLSEQLKQGIVVENRGGANGAIGTAFVAQSPADGYTLVWVTTDTHALNPHVYPKLGYDARAGFEPVGLVGYFPYALMVNAAFPAGDVASFAQESKKREGKVTFASWGVGGSAHVAMEMFKGIGKFDVQHIPYTGAAPAITAVAAGQVDSMILPMSVALAQAAGGKVKLLGLASPRRFAGAANLRTFAEQGYAVDAGTWVGLMAPAGTPDPVVQRLNHALMATLADPKVGNQLLGMNVETASPNTPAQFKAFAAGEFERWGKTIKEANIRLE